MNNIKIIAITHKSASLEEIGAFHLNDNIVVEKLQALKSALNLKELLYLSTCNRVEFIMVDENNNDFDTDYLIDFFCSLYPTWGENQLQKAVKIAEIFESTNAVTHLYKVISSIDSLVVGEREIITQIRKAYEFCNENNLTGDTIRLLIQNAVNVGKKVYTETDIARKPVSIVSLSIRKLREYNIDYNSKFILIGAGQTIKNVARFLCKSGYKNLTIYNRTIQKAKELGEELSCKYDSLESLKSHNENFDVIITCTGASEPILTESIYTKMLSDKKRKIILDLGIPFDVESTVYEKHPVNYINIEEIKSVADKNLKARKKEIIHCEKIIQESIGEFESAFAVRKVEKAMSSVPQQVKEIKTKALETVFANEIGQLDDFSKETLNKVINYLEKKYISLPMKMAREIIIEEKQNKSTAISY